MTLNAIGKVGDLGTKSQMCGKEVSRHSSDAASKKYQVDKLPGKVMATNEVGF